MPSVGAKVLLVEDEVFILRMMRDILSKDFTVLGETSAEAGLEILKRERVDAVVADQMLPGMVGVELLQRASQLQPHAARVLVTASGRVSDAQDAINVAKVRRFLSKPFRPDELRRVVGEAVHEAALVSIRDQLVQELKSRNGVLAEALSMLEARDKVLQRDLEQRTAAFTQIAEKLETLAVRDGLTGTFNHRYFQEALAAEVQNARRRRRGLAVVMVDVDCFGHFNREHGYSEGDVLLQRVAEALVSPSKEGEMEIACRYGADVFAVILPGADLPRAQRYAERVVKEIGGGRDPASPRNATVRAGVALFPSHGATAAELIDAAGKAVETAKTEYGGNRAAVAA